MGGVNEGTGGEGVGVRWEDERFGGRERKISKDEGGASWREMAGLRVKRGVSEWETAEG